VLALLEKERNIYERGGAMSRLQRCHIDLRSVSNTWIQGGATAVAHSKWNHCLLDRMLFARTG